MAKHNILIYSNFYQDIDKTEHFLDATITHCGPGRHQANPYSTKKHSTITEVVNRFFGLLKAIRRNKEIHHIFIDSCINGLLCSAILYFSKKNIYIMSFNIPRHRTTFWVFLTSPLLQRINHFFVHSKTDITLISKTYNIPEERFTFRPFTRKTPNSGIPTIIPQETIDNGYIFSYGGNARDYPTLINAAREIEYQFIIVAREYNLRGLEIPENVLTFTNIPLEECDKLSANAYANVFTFDGSEPSCGQISIVTSLMQGTPTICTDCEAVKDYIVSNATGILVKINDATDLKNAINTIISDPRKRSELSTAAQKWAFDNLEDEATTKVFIKLSKQFSKNN